MLNFSGTTKSGLKVTAMNNQENGELYCSVKDEKGALIESLCGWYRTSDFDVALGHVEQAHINHQAIQIQQGAA